jgi:hypothetical protein
MTNRFSPARIGIGTMLIGGGLGLLLVATILLGVGYL